MGDPWIEDLKMVRVEAQYTSGPGHFLSYTGESRLNEVSYTTHCSLSDAEFAELEPKHRGPERLFMRSSTNRRKQ